MGEAAPVNPYRSERARDAAAASYDAVLARWPVPFEAGHVETRFGPTHVISCGQIGGSPLVLLHGLGTNSTSWFPVVPDLARRHRVHLVDLIGEPGKSAGARPGYRSGAHAAWLDDVFDALGLKRACVVGLSLGGWIALHFALAHPARVERLALLAPASLQRMRGPMLLRAVVAQVTNRPSLIRGLFRYMAAQDAPVMPEWAMDDAILRWRAVKPSTIAIPVIDDDELAALEPPTLLLLGSDDPIYDAARAAARVRGVAPRIRVEVLPRAGHLFPSQHPWVTSGALLDFFEAPGRGLARPA
ncbi:MAG TPA: alpha/beta hydrolase [Anaeromyxobacteraceae bacterium]|nr:alpha/beta hydrolase [Anaeromyxobacteraceae bacterium]